MYNAFTRICFNIPCLNYNIAECLLVDAVRNALKHRTILEQPACCDTPRQLHDNQPELQLKVIWEACFDVGYMVDHPLKSQCRC
jgi:hypothetical protein